jgi:hypothetical protein
MRCFCLLNVNLSRRQRCHKSLPLTIIWILNDNFTAAREKVVWGFVMLMRFMHSYTKECIYEAAGCEVKKTPNRERSSTFPLH